MSNYRMINTAVWKDDWFVNLRSSEQLLFLYLLTNAQTNIAGIYQTTMREVAFDTGIDANEIHRIFRDRFEPDKKAFYFDFKWVVMPNWLKHQKPNANQIVAIRNIVGSLPEALTSCIFDFKQPMYCKPLQAFQSVSKPLVQRKGNESKGKEKKLKEIKGDDKSSIRGEGTLPWDLKAKVDELANKRKMQ